MKMNVKKLWNEICGKEKREKPRENLPKARFIHHETHMKSPWRELGTQAMGDERQIACIAPKYIKFIHDLIPFFRPYENLSK